MDNIDLVVYLKAARAKVDRARMKLMDWQITDDADMAGLVADELQDAIYKLTESITALEYGEMKG